MITCWVCKERRESHGKLTELAGLAVCRDCNETVVSSKGQWSSGDSFHSPKGLRVVVEIHGYLYLSSFFAMGAIYAVPDGVANVELLIELDPPKIAQRPPLEIVKRLDHHLVVRWYRPYKICPHERVGLPCSACGC